LEESSIEISPETTSRKMVTMLKRNVPMDTKKMLSRGLVTFVCATSLIGVAIGLVPDAIAAKSTFRPGLYVGKTSQGEAVKLKVVGCGTKQCLETPNEEAYFSVDLSCGSSGQTEEEIIYLPKNTIAKSGMVDALGGLKPGSTVKIKVARNGTLAGQIHVAETLETGTKCDSGEVTLKAKIGGTAR
jgi:hypothetical protein